MGFLQGFYGDLVCVGCLFAFALGVALVLVM